MTLNHSASNSRLKTMQYSMQCLSRRRSITYVGISVVLSDMTKQEHVTEYKYMKNSISEDICVAFPTLHIYKLTPIVQYNGIVDEMGATAVLNLPVV